MDPVLQEVNQRIQNAIENLKRELAVIRAGRANPTMVENLPVMAYGVKMKLLKVGTITAPQNNLLTVQIWDAGLIQDVLKAIQEANLGLNPSTDGQVIRLPIPPLTSERREEFIKLAHHKMEETRIEVRQVRQEIRSVWEKEDLREDEFDRRSKLLQDLVDETMDHIEELGKAKEQELVQI